MNSSSLAVTLVQTQLSWEQPVENKSQLAAKLAPLQGRTDLVVLPEMFTTGFSMRAAELGEPMDGPTVAWMQEQATQLDAALTGSFICIENGLFYNRLVWVQPGGVVHFYDKRHLFSLAAEHQTFTPGTERLTVEWKGWRICPLVCYDLRFPVWSRNHPDQPYDLLLYIANWPQTRSLHWRSLLQARAIENQAFVAGVNIVGTDGNQLVYGGDSAIIDFSGQHLCQISHCEGVFTTELSLEKLHTYRQQLPFLKDGDTFRLI
ncbi:MAG: amidohydrolase [Saprospiraceae bacterium]|nr:amidohydrolase [Saprospiraceae bacterium]